MSISRQYGGNLNSAPDLEAKMEKAPVKRKEKSDRFASDKKSGAGESELSKALDFISKIELPEKQPMKKLSGKTKTVSVRLDEDVIEAWKKNTSGHTSAMGALITETAHKNGWL
jgi:uncharacterized protein (DUF4415 family)